MTLRERLERTSSAIRRAQFDNDLAALAALEQEMDKLLDEMNRRRQVSARWGE